MKKIYSAFLICFFLFGCKDTDAKLPFLGNSQEIDGKLEYPKIKDFTLTNQEGKLVTNRTFAGKIYVADFIFLSCTSICPRMNIQMTKVYEVFKNDPRVAFLSHTIDPDRDTVEKLKQHAEGLGLNDHWQFVTGSKEKIYDLATNSYFTTAYPDARDRDGYVHGGSFLLVDENRHVRGIYDGTNPADTKKLIADINILLQEL